MLPQPLVGANPGGSASSVKSLSDSLNETKDQMISIVCKHTGMNKKTVEKHISYDHYYTAKEAIDCHIADEVVGIDSLI